MRFLKFLKKYKQIAFGLGILGVVVNIIFFQSINSLVLLIFIIYLVAAGIFYKVSEKFFFILALIFLVLMVPPFLLGHMALAERFSVWEYLFILIGLWQYFYLEILKYFKQ